MGHTDFVNWKRFQKLLTKFLDFQKNEENYQKLEISSNLNFKMSEPDWTYQLSFIPNAQLPKISIPAETPSQDLEIPEPSGEYLLYLATHMIKFS